MKQKFTFTLDAAQGGITLSEAGETDPGTFVTVHSETYSLDTIKLAIAKGQDEFVEKLRRNNMFPPLDLAVKLYEALKNFLEEEGGDTLVVDYEDLDALPARGEKREIDDDDDDDDEVSDVIDELLTVSDEDLTEDDIKEIDSDDDALRYLPDDNSEHEN